MAPVSTWDLGGLWDDPSQTWDPGSALSDVTSYLDLVTSEHRLQPNLQATITALVQPLTDLQQVMQTFPGLFDIDVAAGTQEDAVGEWVGVSREVGAPITGVYFELDSATLGLDQGVLQGPFDPTSGLVALPDDIYRTLLYAERLNNRWDGTVPGAYAIWQALFGMSGYNILIQDLGGMHMLLATTGTPPNPLIQDIYLSGDLNVRPAGVQIDYYMTPAGIGPYFGLDAETTSVAGLDVGAFGFLNNGTGY